MTMKYRTPETRDVALQGGDNLLQFIRGLGRDSFKAPEYRRRTVGAFGELEGGPDPAVRYRLPETLSAEALALLPPEDLQQLFRAADDQYDVLEQGWRGYVPPTVSGGAALGRDAFNPGDAGSMEGRQRLLGMGYRAIEGDDGEGNGVTSWIAPGDAAAYDAGMVETQQRNAALQAIGELQGNLRRAQSDRSQGRLRNENQLLGGIAELGYDFAPGSLGDASVREEIWNARDYLPQFLRNAAKERRFLGGPGDKFRQDGYSWRPPRPWSEGVEEDPPTELGIPEEAGQSYRLPQGMPYDPADPLSEAAYYGGPQYRGPDSVARYQMPGNPDDWVTEADANGNEIARYRRKLRPYGVDDRIVRDAGQTGYNDLRPGFYNAGSITGPTAPPEYTPSYAPMRPVFDDPVRSYRAPAPRPLAGGMELRPGVKVRNPFEESVRRLGPRPSRGMFS